jgi:hypothetical protein
MKKILIALMLFVSMSFSAVFAGEKKVSPYVLQAFQSEFTTATDVNWTITDAYFKAAFILNEQFISAYYTPEGELFAVTRNVSTTQLPIHLMNSIKKDFSGYWVSELFEMNKSDGSSYYIRLENADEVLILRSSPGENWLVYDKTRKA